MMMTDQWFEEDVMKAKFSMTDACKWCGLLCAVTCRKRLRSWPDIAAVPMSVCAGMRVKLLQTVLAAAILMTLKEEVFLAVRSVLALKPRKLH
jgi:hypothetical protein